MPDVRMPDGTILRNVPENASREDIMRVYQRAHQAGAIAPPPKSTLRQLGDATANVAAGVGEGVLGLPDVLWDAATGVRRAANAGVGAIGSGALRAVGADGAADWWERGSRGVEHDLARMAKPSTPITRAVPAPRGTAGQVARFAAQVAGGAAIPLAPKRVAPLKMPPAAPSLPRPVAARQARFERVGVKAPTTGMVTRDPRAWNFEREAAKRYETGDELVQAFKGVDDDLVGAARGIVDRQGGNIGAEATGSRVQTALADKNQQMQDEIGAIYKSVRDQAGDTRVPTLENLKMAQIHPDWADNNEFDLMTAAVNKRLARYADADDGAAGLNVKQAEELRKFIGNLGPNSPQTYSMRRILQDGLDADVLDNVGGAPFAQARQAARARFEEFKNTFPGRIADEGIAPEKLATRVTQGGTSLDDLRQLRTSLTTGSPRQVEQGQQALQPLRAQVTDNIVSSGITPDGKINGTTIYNTFTKNADRLRVLMDPEDYKAIRRYAMAARDATADVPYSAVNHSNSASAFANILAKPEGVKTPTLVGSLAKRLGAATLGGPLGYAAMEAGDELAKSRVARTAAQKMAEQVSLARDPNRALQAAYLGQQQVAPNTEELIADLVSRLPGISGATNDDIAIQGSGLLGRPYAPLAASDKEREEEKRKRRR